MAYEFCYLRVVRIDPAHPLLDSATPALVVGLMSGTSVDGVDAACCRLSRDPANGEIDWEVTGTTAIEYSEEMADLLRTPASLTVPELAALGVEVAEVFASAALESVRAAGEKLADVALIGSHGQTMWHDPQGEIGDVPATLQIGEAAVIAERTGCAVWSDFRPADVAAGGEGAPLVPYVDALLFRRPERWRACLNLGGIANVTLLPPGRGIADVVAFDTGPGNIVLDALARRLLGVDYDESGQVASEGVVETSRLRRALRDPYFARSAPKSTGRERFGVAFVEEHFSPLDELERQAVAERLATAVALTVETVGDAIEGESGGPAIPPDAEIVVSGGGRRNRAVMEGLADRLAPSNVVTSDSLGLDGDAKEAVAFAILAWESACGRPANVPAATGADHPVRLGKLAFPPPK